MDELRAPLQVKDAFRYPRTVSRFASWAVHILILLSSLAVSYVLVDRLGAHLFVIALAGLFCGTLFAIVSFRNLLVPFIVWILSVGGFRFLWSIRSPVLPDLYLDRMMLLWLALVFMVKYVAQRRALKAPFGLDMLLLLHALYIYARVYVQDLEFVLPWFTSVAIPYAAYFFAKNIVDNAARIRVLWWTLLALLFYFSVTAIAEKFRIDNLIFPRSIVLAKDVEFPGRSIGPFAQPGVFGTAFAMMIPLNLYFVATVRSRGWRIAVGASLLASMVGLYFTYTRGSWIAGVAGLICAILLNWRSYAKLVVPSAIVISLVATFVLGLGQDKFMKERVENQDTLGSRVGTAATALRIWRHHPLIGVGYFHFPQVREQYIQPIEVPYLGTILFSQFRRNSIHDIYLGSLAEDGLIGAVLQFGIYFLILKTFLRKFRWRHMGDPFATYFMPVIAGVFIAYLVGGLAFDYRYFSFMGTIFYMTAGILAGYQRPEQAHVS